jgi:hypothetical protein
MTAKGKAIQVLVAVSVTAVAYTLYTNSPGKRPMPAQEKAAVAVKADKNKNAKAARENTTAYKQDAVPGYCNPEEGSK